MPYANKKKQRKFMARQYRTRYNADEKFKDAEKERKADWYQRNREKVIARVVANKAKKAKTPFKK
ncbi:MAG: hypothetical protein KGR46_10855 [Verrucomicrobia bacterium]|nr:hypothetical protein [Verrucomicrobiota bacterium]